MRVRFIIGLTITAVFFLSIPAAPGEEEPRERPRIEFEELKRFVGEVWEGEDATHIFKFKNVGQNELVIENVRTSCGCTAVLVSKKNIKPGEAGEIKATFDTKRYSGKQGKNIYVSTNDPDNRTVKLRLEVNVKTAGHFQPRYLRFGRVLRGEEAVKSTTFIPDIPSLKITDLRVNPDIFSAEIVDPGGEEDEERQEYEIRVALSPRAPIGRHHGNLQVFTDHRRAAKLQTRISAQVTGVIKVAPRMLFFNKQNQQEKTEKTIRIENEGEGDIRILSVESTADQFDVAISPLQPGRKFEIKVRLKDDRQPGRYRGEIVITTDLAGEEKISVPLRSNNR